MSKFKVQAKYGNKTKFVEMERAISYADFKIRLEELFDVGNILLRAHFSDGTEKQIHQDGMLKEALRECEKRRSSFLTVYLSKEEQEKKGSSFPPLSVPKVEKYGNIAVPRPSPPKVPAPGVQNPCDSCGLEIAGQGLRSAGGIWHLHCLACMICKVSLLDGNFTRHEGRLYCNKHYKEVVAEPCAACLQPIDDKYLEINGKKFHTSCFVCVKCQKPFSSTYTITDDGKPIHPACL